MPDLLKALVGLTIVAAIGAAVGAILLQFACKQVTKYKPPWRMAYKASLVAALVSIPVAALALTLGETLPPWSTWLLPIVGFFVEAAIFARVIRLPKTGRLGLRKGLLVRLIELCYEAVLVGAILFAYTAATL